MRELLSKPKPTKIEWFALCCISFISLLPIVFLYTQYTSTIIQMVGELGFGMSFILIMSSIMASLMIIFKMPTKQTRSDS